MDADGYPTKKELQEIRYWDFHDTRDFHGLMDYIYNLWYDAEDAWHRHDDVYKISTVGWSGNEDIICALQRNMMFWALYWYSSQRGGHYVFCPHNVDPKETK
jgi:hypothetical protein